MITLISLWENGWLDPAVEAFMWKQLAKAYEVDEVVFAPLLLDDGRSYPRQTPNIEKAVEEVEGELVYLMPSKGEDLTEFDHPENAAYVFGNAKQSNLPLSKAYPGKVVYIPTPKKIDFFGISAAAIVLADRRQKYGG